LEKTPVSTHQIYKPSEFFAGNVDSYALKIADDVGITMSKMSDNDPEEKVIVEFPGDKGETHSLQVKGYGGYILTLLVKRAYEQGRREGLAPYAKHTKTLRFKKG
jgi:hypothetical protein